MASVQCLVFSEERNRSVEHKVSVMFHGDLGVVVSKLELRTSQPRNLRLTFPIACSLWGWERRALSLVKFLSGLGKKVTVTDYKPAE